MQDSVPERRVNAFWRDERFLRVAGQIIFAALLIGFFVFLAVNMLGNLNQQGMNLSFGFIDQVAGFDIGASFIQFDRTGTYIRAFLVGLINTLVVSFLGILFATILGILIGVARLSQNFLVNRLSRIYIEILRNIPLLVLLVFLYRAVFLKLPRVANALIFPGPIYLSNRGIAMPWFIPTVTFGTYLLVMSAGFVLALLVGWFVRRQGRQTGRPTLWPVYSLLIWLAVALIGWFLLPHAPLQADVPQPGGLNLKGGLVLTPEFMALLAGLTVYTSAFIAEIVRAGIQSVSKGQVEASHALGLSSFQTLRLVVFPQALRVIVPPLTSQYLNLTKNSSLAVAIAYPDVFYVSNTILNQTGRAVEMIAIVMLTYLLLSLLTAMFMNWYNQRIRLVER